MNSKHCIILAAIAASMAGCTSGSETSEPDNSDTTIAESLASPTAQSLIGDWQVSLFFDPNGDPSPTTLKITSIDEGVMSGSFYETPFEHANVTAFKNEVTFTVITSDGTGPYATSGRLLADGTLRGQTLSTGRDFLMPWTAEKDKD